MPEKTSFDPEDFKVTPGKKFSLKNCKTDIKKKIFDKKTGEEILQKDILEISSMQDKLYAEGKHSILIVLQGMDTSGKDGTVKHLLSGLNPSGVKVHNFKTPSSIELSHDYLWRHYKELPARGEIGIFNRSHYENVLITKVHPEMLLQEKLPGIHSVKDVQKEFWEKRYDQINNFEKIIAENGTIILKFFLHLSKDEQKRRFIERIDDPKKNWKFSLADIKERGYWDDYQKAYTEAIYRTSTEYAPWFIIPADDKWYTRTIIGNIIFKRFRQLNLSYPTVSAQFKEILQQAKQTLLVEK